MAELVLFILDYLVALFIAVILVLTLGALLLFVGLGCILYFRKWDKAKLVFEFWVWCCFFLKLLVICPIEVLWHEYFIPFLLHDSLRRQKR